MVVLENILNDIDGCDSVESLKKLLDEVAQNYGFIAYSFIDSGNPQVTDPFVVTTTTQKWISDYESGNFLNFDPILNYARRTSLPFIWSDLSPIKYLGKRIPAGVRCLTAAKDHGYNDGFTVPFHVTDQVGRVYSSVCSFFWSSRTSKLRFMLKRNKYNLHIIMIYWAQKVFDIANADINRHERFLDFDGNPIFKNPLTDRERDVLMWASRGKTMSDTADILDISSHTVETHMRKAMFKLGAENKTKAVAVALYLGAINI